VVLGGVRVHMCWAGVAAGGLQQYVVLIVALRMQNWQFYWQGLARSLVARYHLGAASSVLQQQQHNSCAQGTWDEVARVSNSTRVCFALPKLKGQNLTCNAFLSQELQAVSLLADCTLHTR
jgi:hypothetical protein